jgi:hypothetical protein
MGWDGEGFYYQGGKGEKEKRKKGKTMIECPLIILNL